MSVSAEKRTNAEWIAALRAGEADALHTLRANLCRRLRTALAGRAGQSDAEDFAQLAIERILASLDSFRGDSRFTTWACAIAVRVAFSHLRRKEWGAVSLDALVARGDRFRADAAETGGESAARQELLDALQRAIQEDLTERQRAVVVGELDGVPTSVLCEALNTTQGALYKMHHDARKKLRRRLEDEGITVDDLRFALRESAQDE